MNEFTICYGIEFQIDVYEERIHEMIDLYSNTESSIILYHDMRKLEELPSVFHYPKIIASIGRVLCNLKISKVVIQYTEEQTILVERIANLIPKLLPKFLSNQIEGILEFDFWNRRVTV